METNSPETQAMLVCGVDTLVRPLLKLILILGVREPGNKSQ